MASKSTNYVRYWFLTIDPDVNDVDGDEMCYIINTVLSDPRGWNKKGYYFQQVSIEDGLWARGQPGMKKFVIHVHVSTNDTVKSECGFGNLSCADMKSNIIYFNRDRWLYGSKESRMSLDAYRTYVTNHEFGHLLDRGHHGCSRNRNDICPAMLQQTISKGCCKPNPWPLDWE